MSEVINFRDGVKDKGDNVYQCKCENASFLIYEDGRVECAECGIFHEGERLETAVRYFVKKQTQDKP